MSGPKPPDPAAFDLDFSDLEQTREQDPMAVTAVVDNQDLIARTRPPERAAAPAATRAIDPDVLEVARRLAGHEEAATTPEPPPAAASEPVIPEEPRSSVSVIPAVWHPDGAATSPERFLQEITQDHEQLGASLGQLHQEIDALRGGTPPLDVAIATLRRRAAALVELRTALARVYFCLTDLRMAKFVGHGTNLGEYLKGLYTAANLAVAALRDLAIGVTQGEPDAPSFAHRMRRAAHMRFDVLEPQVRADVTLHCGVYVDPADPLRMLPAHVEELFARGRAL